MQTEAVKNKLDRLRMSYDLLGVEIRELERQIKTDGNLIELTNKLMTTEEVAEFLGIDGQTVSQWALKGRLKAYRIGNVWRYQKKDIGIFMSIQENVEAQKKAQEQAEKATAKNAKKSSPTERLLKKEVKA